MNPTLSKTPGSTDQRPWTSTASRHGGFTLIEMIVVLGIIVMLAVTALPAIRFITGARSLDGAQNIVSAMIARAHTQAINDRQYRGVFFFLDPVSDRTTLALVKPEIDNSSNSDIDQYDSWALGYSYQAPDTTNTWAEPIIALVQSPNSNDKNTVPTAPGTIKSVARRYKATVTNTASASNKPPQAPWQDGTFLWLQLMDDTEFQQLPDGVAAQLINDPQGQALAVGPPALGQRYLRTGAILFDGKGRLDSVQYGVHIDKSNYLARAIWGYSLAQDTVANDPHSGLTQLPSINVDFGGQPAAGPQNWPSFFSQFGVVLYDRQQFKGTVSPTSNQQFTDGDVMTHQFFLPGGNASGAQRNTQADKELWLDGNTLPLMVNRYSGTLIRGQ